MKIQKKVIAFSMIFILSLFVFTACDTSKTALTAEQFSEQMSQSGYETADVTEQFSEEKAVESVTLAINENYQIEFFVLSSNEIATSSFEKNKTDFEAIETNSSSYKSISGNNYIYYYRTTDDLFCLVSQVENTMIYVLTDKMYADEIKETIKHLGYI